MKIKFLGTLGEDVKASKSHSKQSGILINSILFDVGNKEFINKYKPRKIFITHLHPDHAYWVKDKEKPPEFVLPGKITKWNIDNYKIIAIPTVHSKKVKSYAYLIEKDSVRILYTGDMIWIDKDYHNKIKNLDLVITDGSFIKKDGMIRKDKKTGEIYGHQGIPNLIKFFKGLKARRIIFTHFGDWLTKNEKAGHKKLKELEVEYASDSKVIELSSLESPDVEAIKPKTIAKEDLAGLVLVEPHGEMIASGEKKAVIKPRKLTKHIGEVVHIIQGNYTYGTMRLEEPEIIKNLAIFKKLEPVHKVSPEERKAWCKKYKSWCLFPLYMYRVIDVKPFPRPLPISRPRGAQVWIEKVKLVSKLNTGDLLVQHAKLHFSKLDCACSNAHSIIASELESRGYPHLISSYNIMDRTYELIKDWKTYNPAKIRDEVLRDDWRIVHAWMKLIKEKKRLKSPQFIKYSLEDQKKIIKDLKEKIKKEMIKRGWKPRALAFKLPEGMQIEDIDAPYVKKLNDKQLLEIWEFLVSEARRLKKVNEPLFNAGIVVGIELRKRDLWEENKDNKLGKAVSFPVEEYPFPRLSGDITLKEVMSALREEGIIPIKGEPYASYLCGRIVNEGRIPPDHDIDLLFRQYPDPRIILALKRLRNKEIARRIHPVFDIKGPEIGFSIPVHGYALNPLPKNLQVKGFGVFRKALAKELKVGRPVRGLKPKSGFGKHEFWDVKEAWLEWGANNIKPGLFIEEKVDGRRFQAHIDKKKKIFKLFTEDRQRDRSEALPELMEELKNLKVENIILDGEILVFTLPGKIEARNAETRRRVGDLVPREDTASLTVGKVPDEIKENLVYVIYDILYLNDKELAHSPYKSRREVYTKVIPKNLKYIASVRGEEARNMRDFFRLVSKYRSLPGSEGVVIKRSDSEYPVKYSGENRTGEWAKIKNLKEIDVMVLGIKQKKTKAGKLLPTWMYESYFEIPRSELKKWYPGDIKEYKGKVYARIGLAYGTGKKARIGDIITVMPIRVREYRKDNKRRVTWMFPYFKEIRTDKKSADTLTTVERLIKLGTGPSPEQRQIRKMSALEFEEWLEFPREKVVTIELDNCPYWNYLNICPLRSRFYVKKRPQYLTIFQIEQLKFPVGCPLANHFKCHFVKDYYYTFKQYQKLSELPVRQAVEEKIKEELETMENLEHKPFQEAIIDLIKEEKKLEKLINIKEKLRGR